MQMRTLRLNLNSISSNILTCREPYLCSQARTLSQGPRLWRLADDHLHHVAVSASFNTTIIPPERTLSNYDSPASDAGAIQFGVKGVYLPRYGFNLPSKQAAHQQGVALAIVRWTDIDMFSDVVSHMVRIVWHLRLDHSCVVGALVPTNTDRNVISVWGPAWW